MMGHVIMPREKMHALFGLILMTQYFSAVTTSVSLLSSSKSSLSPSLSESSTSSKSLLLSTSSPFPVFFILPTSGEQPHDINFHSHLVPYSHHHLLYHPTANTKHSPVDMREAPMKISSNSKHQKRHTRSENGNSSIHAIHTVDHGSGSIGQDSKIIAHRQPHLLSTSSPSATVDNKTTESNTFSNKSTSTNVAKMRKARRYDGPTCRHKWDLPTHLFELHTCALCYKYVRDVFPLFEKNKKLQTQYKMIEGFPTLVIIHNGSLIVANVSDPTSPIWATFHNKEAQTDWTGCCQAAKECCERIQVSQYSHQMYNNVSQPENTFEPDNTSDDYYCPPTWDGWQCWNSTKAGETATATCPHYIYFLTEPPTCHISVEKTCNYTGTWARIPTTNEEWTNYTSCMSHTVTLYQNRAYVLISAYAISIVALVPAVVIFFSYKQLRVHRIILHQNLFFSLILNALLVIIFKTTVMMGENNSMHTANSTDPSAVEKNSVACRVLLILTKYSRITNYMWMLCEGYYLHKLIASAFAEQKNLLVFYLLGWGFPLVPTVFYAIFRMLAANDQCWVVPQGQWEWVLNGPSLLSLLINTLFLINIIRVLVTKLRAAHAQEPSQYRKAVRATLVLLPLFGLHFIVTIYRPSSSGICQNWTMIYTYANDVLDGMQGFLVALIFCYCNGEVLSLLKRSYMRWKDEHFAVSRRRNSRHRPSRGSVLGRSVVSTHIYSSIPPSPETNVIALPVGSNSTSNDPSPSSQTVATNLLTVNGASGPITISSNTSPNMRKSDSKSSLKNRKNHTSTTTNGNAINMYVSSEYGSVKENPGVEISCV